MLPDIAGTYKKYENKNDRQSENLQSVNSS
jgi:hypothetical protein